MLRSSAASLKNFSFTIVTDDKGGSEEIAERLYPSCADACVGESDLIVSISFHRNARTFMDAAGSAIDALAAGGCRAVCIQSRDIVDLPEIARKTKRTRESVRLLVAGRRGPGNFPATAYPDQREIMRLWHWPDVERWFAAYEKRPPVLVDHADDIATINAALAFAKLRSRVPAKLRPALDRLATGGQPRRGIGSTGRALAS